jgi:pathogenesis-related protein 1
MSDIRGRVRAALVVAAWAAALQYGCSSAATNPGPDTSETPSGEDASTPSGSSSGGSGSGAGGSGPGADGATASGDDATAAPVDDAGQAAADHDGSTPSGDAGSQGGSPQTDAGPDASAPGSDSGASPDESAWLDPMNQARAAVMANEPPLTLNPIAAQVALNYAMMCNYEHNANRNSDYAALGGGSGGLGENIAAGAPSLSIASANSGWIGEDANYDYSTNTCNMGPMNNLECGHYTQIVWKTTTSVGCALVTCTTNSPFPAQYGTTWGFAVCDYAPPGNLVPQGSTTTERPY